MSSLPRCIKKYRHYEPKALRTLLPSLRRQLLYSVHLNAVGHWDSSPLPGDGHWSEGTAGQCEPVEEPEPLVWWSGIQHGYGEKPQASQACPTAARLPPLWRKSHDCPGVDHAPLAPPSFVSPFSLPAPGLPSQTPLPWSAGVLHQ